MTEAVPTTIRGVTYPSRAAAARAVGVTRQAVTGGIKADRLDQVGAPYPQAKPFEMHGVSFPTRAAASMALGQSRNYVSYVLRHGSHGQRAKLSRLVKQYAARQRAEQDSG